MDNKAFPDIELPVPRNKKKKSSGLPPLFIFTDGGYSGKKKVGGCAFVVVVNKEIVHSDSTVYEKSTSNRMELKAAINGIMWATANMPEYRVVLVSDSKYVLGVPNWSQRWRANGWVTSSGDDVKNKNLVVTLLEVVQSANNYSSAWVEGHSGNRFNELADAMTKEAMDNPHDAVEERPDHWEQTRISIEDRPLW